MRKHRLAGKRLKHLGQRRMHTLALSGGKNDNVDHGKFLLNCALLNFSRIRAGWG